MGEFTVSGETWINKLFPCHSHARLHFGKRPASPHLSSAQLSLPVPSVSHFIPHIMLQLTHLSPHFTPHTSAPILNFTSPPKSQLSPHTSTHLSNLTSPRKPCLTSHTLPETSSQTSPHNLLPPTSPPTSHLTPQTSPIAIQTQLWLLCIEVYLPSPASGHYLVQKR